MIETKVFQMEQIEEIRTRAENARRLEIDTVPEGWCRSQVDLGKLLEAFPSLKLKSGYELGAYQFRLGGNGHGLVFAVPQGLILPDPDELISTKEMPYPDGAIEEVMEVIEGNGTPWSYLSASIFSREVGEFGAMWHGNNWTMHTIIDSLEVINGLATKPGATVDENEWEWVDTKPIEWGPRVYEVEGLVTVDFKTFSALGHKCIYKHTDTYEPGKYIFKSVEKLIARGPMGYVF